jgi:alginate O-acetyltransferase complex protein AlgI
MMFTATLAAWLIFVGALALLTVSLWRRNTNTMIRAGLVVIAAASLSYALAESAVVDKITAPLLVALDVVLVFVTWQLARSRYVQTPLGIAWIIVLVLALGVAKLPAIQPYIGPGVWIGVSYVIFRLIHIVLDARRGRLEDGTLPEAIVYALNPVTLVSGPIDRVQHNIAEQRCQPADPAQYATSGVWRLFVGIFKLTVLSNLCNVFITAHDMAQHPDQPQGIAWLWLIAFSFNLYFNFAAYSDIAIGAGLLMGLRLPENFTNPYAQPTIARFWQAWHITLSTWLRDYIFFPLSRWLLSRYGTRFSVPILLVSHLTTMIACGLWHGLTGGFIAWGIWHGLGLFTYSQVPNWRRRAKLPVLPTGLSIALTFSFVTLGWVFFAADVPTAFAIFGRLLGVR